MAAHLVTEGYNGDIITEANPWPKVYSAFQNRTIIQVEAKGAKIYGLNGSEVPCLQVHVGNVTGIIPAQETGLNDIPDDLANLSNKEKKAVIRRLENRLVGLPIWILIIAIDRKNEIFVASRRRALEIMAPQAWKRIEEGATLPGTVRELGPKHAILDLGGVEAVMYAHEISWSWTDDVREALEKGKTYEVKVIHADRENGKVEVSLKQATPSPWPDCAKRYEKGGIYSGVVSGVIERGVFINLEPGVDVFAYHPKFTPVKKGDKVKVFLVKVDADRQRIFGRIRG